MKNETKHFEKKEQPQMDKETASEIIVQAIDKAVRAGAYTLQETSAILTALKAIQ